MPEPKKETVTLDRATVIKAAEYVRDLGQSKHGYCPQCGVRTQYINITHRDTCAIGKTLLALQEAIKK